MLLLQATTFRTLRAVIGGLLIVAQGVLGFSVPTHAAPGSLLSGEHSAASSCSQYPQGINLATLSDAQLMSYGLPTHALIAENPTMWGQILPHAQHQTCGSSPSTHIKKPLVQPAGPAPCPTPYYSGEVCQQDFWAGNEAFVSRGTYRISSVEFRVPSIPTTALDLNSLAYYWAGIGGDPGATGGPSYGLVQAGVFSEVTDVGVQYNESWWEVVTNANQIPPQNLPLNRLNPGDLIYVYVSSNYQSDGYNYFYIANLTSNGSNGCYLATDKSIPPGTKSCGSLGHYDSDSASAECIVEKQSNQPLAEFNYNQSPKDTVRLTYCYANTVYISNVPHIYDLLINSSGTQLATCGPLDSYGDFNVYWHAPY